MSLIDTKKKLKTKIAEDYILRLIVKCPKLADISPAEMYALPNWKESSFEDFEKELSATLKRWKELYESTRTSE